MIQKFNIGIPYSLFASKEFLTEVRWFPNMSYSSQKWQQTYPILCLNDATKPIKLLELTND